MTASTLVKAEVRRESRISLRMIESVCSLKPRIFLESDMPRTMVTPESTTAEATRYKATPCEPLNGSPGWVSPK